MAYIKDIEDVLNDILSVMTTGGALNAQIAAVEAEKVTRGVGLTGGLPSIDADAYFLQTWDDKILMKKVAVMYGFNEDQPEDVGSGGMVVAETYKIYVNAVVLDDKMNNDGNKRVLRYSKALRQLFSSEAAKSAVQERMAISLIKPMPVEMQGAEYKVGGIEILIKLVS